MRDLVVPACRSLLCAAIALLHVPTMAEPAPRPLSLDELAGIGVRGTDPPPPVVSERATGEAVSATEPAPPAVTARPPGKPPTAEPPAASPLTAADLQAVRFRQATVPRQRDSPASPTRASPTRAQPVLAEPAPSEPAVPGLDGPSAGAQPVELDAAGLGGVGLVPRN